jgi:hypothetical protein
MSESEYSSTTPFYLQAKDRLRDTKEAWRDRMIPGYSIAYDTAYGNYQTKLKEQKDRNKRIPQLFIFIASVATGCGMMAAFGTRSVGAIAGTALYELSNKWLREATRGLNWAYDNAQVKFAVGALLDKTDEIISETAKQKIMQSFAEPEPLIPVSTPFAVGQRLVEFVGRAYDANLAFLVDIDRKQGLSDADKQARWDEHKNTTDFFKPPERSHLNEDMLATKMELALYLSEIWRSLVIVTEERWGGDSFWIPRRTQKEVTGSVMWSQGGSISSGVGPQPFYVHSYLDINELGSEMRDQVDVLCERANKLYGQCFRGGFYGNKGSTAADDRIRAKEVLDQLARSMKPMAGFLFRNEPR